MAKGRLNIKKAIKKKGSLTASAKRAHAVTKKGTIKVAWINKMARRPGKIGARARFAKTLRKMRKR